MINNMLGILDLFMPVPAAQAAVSINGGTDVWQLMFSAGPVVKLVLLMLVLFSVSSWAVILTKYKVIWDAKKGNLEFSDAFWSANSLSAAFQQTRGITYSPLAQVFQLGYAELTRIMRLSDHGQLPTGSMENLRRALTRGQAAENTKLGKRVTWLATCANTAPFIGLFGTVWGIMDAFRSIGATGAANLATVAPGIAEALVATAVGLFAAIPAVVFYNFFNRRLLVLEADMDSFVQDFLNLVERDIMRRQGQAVEAVRPAGV